MNVSENKDYLDGNLVEIVKDLDYKSGWKLYIAHEVLDDGSGGWHLFVVPTTENSQDPDDLNYRVRHGFLIPPASYNYDTWSSWVFDRLGDVDTHERGEFFKLKGIRVFAPHHSNGENPYIVWHTGDYATAAKSSGDD